MNLILLLILAYAAYYMIARVTRRPLYGIAAAIAAFFLIPLAFDQAKMIL